jgi:hypothetical protein
VVKILAPKNRSTSNKVAYEKTVTNFLENFLKRQVNHAVVFIQQNSVLTFKKASKSTLPF